MYISVSGAFALLAVAFGIDFFFSRFPRHRKYRIDGWRIVIKVVRSNGFNVNKRGSGFFFFVEINQPIN